MKFKELNISNSIQKALEDLQYENASEIQEKAIPVILSGRDIIGQSQTGTGKTAAFLVPILEKINKSDKSVQAIVLCPTRELALQVSGEARKFLKYTEGIKTTAIYGGESIEKQIKELKRGTQIVIGTPGRVMDHMRRKTLKLGATKFVILDEADEMLNMGFEEDIKTILEDIPSRQTLLFSATMPKRILELTKKYQDNPEYIKITQTELVVPNIEQVYFETTEKAKLPILGKLLTTNNFNCSVVFCNTKKKVEDITGYLKSEDYTADCLHGDMKQSQRDQVMKKFKNGEIKILVATDVAARGIDVENLDCVFNYDLPQDEEYYVHRIGRTGRNGKSGIAYSFIGSRDRMKLRDIERYAHTKLEFKSAPTEKELSSIFNKKRVEKIEETINNMANKENRVIEELCKKYSEKEIAKALYEMLYPPKVIEINEPEERRFNDRERSRSRNKDKSRNENRQSRSRKSSQSQDMVRVFMNVGRKDRISPGDIVGGIASNTTISGKEIGKVDILEKFSFVELPKACATSIIADMANKQIKGRKVSIEIAKSM